MKIVISSELKEKKARLYKENKERLENIVIDQNQSWGISKRGISKQGRKSRNKKMKLK